VKKPKPPLVKVNIKKRGEGVSSSITSLAGPICSEEILYDLISWARLGI